MREHFVDRKFSNGSLALIDQELWDEVIAAEETAKAVMKSVADQWEDVSAQYGEH